VALCCDVYSRMRLTMKKIIDNKISPARQQSQFTHQLSPLYILTRGGDVNVILPLRREH